MGDHQCIKPLALLGLFHIGHYASRNITIFAGNY